MTKKQAEIKAKIIFGKIQKLKTRYSNIIHRIHQLSKESEIIYQNIIELTHYPLKIGDYIELESGIKGIITGWGSYKPLYRKVTKDGKIGVRVFELYQSWKIIKEQNLLRITEEDV